MIQTILGKVPAKSNQYRIIRQGNRSALAKSKEIKDYETSFYLQCNHYNHNLIASPFMLRMDVYFECSRSDLDNSLKVVLDCLQVCKAIKNDNLCTRIEATKHIDKRNPRIEFELTKIEEL